MVIMCAEGQKNDPPPVEMIWHIERMYEYARPLPLRSITPSTIPFDMAADAIVDIPLSILWYRYGGAVAVLVFTCYKCV